MDKFELRTSLVILFYEYVKENPHNLNEDKKKQLLQDVLTLANTLQKVESPELINFLVHIGALDKNRLNKTPSTEEKNSTETKNEKIPL